METSVIRRLPLFITVAQIGRPGNRKNLHETYTIKTARRHRASLIALDGFVFVKILHGVWERRSQGTLSSNG
jgi:hypothetical protein